MRTLTPTSALEYKTTDVLIPIQEGKYSVDSSRLYISLANPGSTPVVISPNGSSTYNELNHEWKHWKTRLQDTGVHSSSVVALEADYNTVVVAALIALLNLKAITVSISSLPDEEHEETLMASGARFYTELSGTK